MVQGVGRETAVKVLTLTEQQRRDEKRHAAALKAADFAVTADDVCDTCKAAKRHRVYRANCAADAFVVSHLAETQNRVFFFQPRTHWGEMMMGLDESPHVSAPTTTSGDD